MVKFKIKFDHRFEKTLHGFRYQITNNVLKILKLPIIFAKKSENAIPKARPPGPR
jgi:hypothetical protein